MKFDTRIHCGLIVACVVLSVTACSNDPGEASEVSSEVSSEASGDMLSDVPLIVNPDRSNYRQIRSAAIGTPFEAWLYDSQQGMHVDSARYDSLGRFHFSNSNPLVSVVNRPMAQGESLTFSATLRSTDGNPTQVRMLVARDCSLEAEEYSEETRWVVNTVVLEVTHTFNRSYECAKVQIQVLNGDDGDPRYLDIYRPQITFSSE